MKLNITHLQRIFNFEVGNILQLSPVIRYFSFNFLNSNVKFLIKCKKPWIITLNKNEFNIDNHQ